MLTAARAREAKSQVTIKSVGPLSCLYTSGGIDDTLGLFIASTMESEGLYCFFNGNENAHCVGKTDERSQKN